MFNIAISPRKPQLYKRLREDSYCVSFQVALKSLFLFIFVEVVGLEPTKLFKTSDLQSLAIATMRHLCFFAKIRGIEPL